MTWRQKSVTYAVVVPFAILLAFPFYFALVTMFKTNLDLANVENSPYVYNDLEGNFHWDFWNYATFEHLTFLFRETNYPTWLLNTLLVGGAVVGITLLLALPAGYALARLAGGWGQSAGVAIFLVYLIPPTLLFLPLSRLITQLDLKDSLWSLILIYPRGRRTDRRRVPPPGLRRDRLADLAPRDPDRRDLRVLALRERVHLRVHVHLELRATDGVGGDPKRSDPGRCLLLAVADGGDADSRHPPRASLHRVPRPFYQGLYRGSIPLENRAERRNQWQTHPTSSCARAQS